MRTVADPEQCSQSQTTPERKNYGWVVQEISELPCRGIRVYGGPTRVSDSGEFEVRADEEELMKRYAVSLAIHLRYH